MNTEQPTGQSNNKKFTAIIISLIILLLVAIGVIVYLVLSRSKEVAEKVNQDSKTKVEQPAAITKKTYCVEHEKMCFDYPSDWKLASKPWKYSDTSMEVDRVQVTAPDESVRLTLQSGITGIGGVCTPQEMGKTRVINSKLTISGYKADTVRGATAYTVALIVSNKEETEFTPKVGLTNNLALINNTELSACDSVYFGMVDGRNLTLDGTNYGGVQFVSGSSLGQTSDMEKEDPDKTYKTLEEAKRALDSSSYKTAFEVISSAHYK